MKTKNILLFLLATGSLVICTMLAYSKFMCAEYVLCAFYLINGIMQLKLMSMYCKDNFKIAHKELSWKEMFFNLPFITLFSIILIYFIIWILIYFIIWLNDWLTPSICN